MLRKELTGRVDWCGEALLGRPPHEIARRGVGYVPEARDVFPTLTVEQNLELGWMPRRRAMVARRDDAPLPTVPLGASAYGVRLFDRFVRDTIEAPKRAD